MYSLIDVLFQYTYKKFEIFDVFLKYLIWISRKSTKT